MARTQMDQRQLENRILTGASFIPELMFYDETSLYSISDRVYWKGDWYIANAAITGVLESDLTQSPDISIDWTLEPKVTNPLNTIATATNSTVQIFTDVITEIVTANQINTTEVSISGTSFLINTTGNFSVKAQLNFINANNKKNLVTTRITINGIDYPEGVSHCYVDNDMEVATALIIIKKMALVAGDDVRITIVTATTTNVELADTESYFNFEYRNDI